MRLGYESFPFCKVWCEGVWVWGAWKQGAWKQGSAKWVRDSSLQQHHWSQHHLASPVPYPGTVESEVWSQLGVTNSVPWGYLHEDWCFANMFCNNFDPTGLRTCDEQIASPEVCSARSYTNGREWDVWHWPEDYFLLPQHWSQIFFAQKKEGCRIQSVDLGNRVIGKPWKVEVQFLDMVVFSFQDSMIVLKLSRYSKKKILADSN